MSWPKTFGFCLGVVLMCLLMLIVYYVPLDPEWYMGLGFGLGLLALGGAGYLWWKEREAGSSSGAAAVMAHMNEAE